MWLSGISELSIKQMHLRKSMLITVLGLLCPSSPLLPCLEAHDQNNTLSSFYGPYEPDIHVDHKSVFVLESDEAF